MPQKLILAVANDLLPEAAKHTGFMALEQAQALETLEQAGLWIGPRPTLETMPQFKQIIPYIALKFGDKLVKYTRTPKGGESRLHGRISVGLGGHIDLPDVVLEGAGVNLNATLSNAAQREVDEELAGVTVASKRWIGMLVDNSNDVGQVHIGVVALWELASLPHGSAEDEIGDVGLATLAELQADESRLEKWTSLLVSHLASAGEFGTAKQ